MIDPLEHAIDESTHDACDRGARDNGVHLAAIQGDEQYVGSNPTLRRGEKFGADYNDEPDRRRNTNTREDKRRGARKTDTTQDCKTAETEASRGLDRNRVDIANAIDRVEEDRPNGRVRDQDDLHREALTPQEDT